MGEKQSSAIADHDQGTGGTADTPGRISGIELQDHGPVIVGTLERCEGEARGALTGGDGDLSGERLESVARDGIAAEGIADFQHAAEIAGTGDAPFAGLVLF